MKKLNFLLLLLLIPFVQYAQSCSANAGGAQTLCVSDLMNLYGEDSPNYLHPLDIEWSVISSPASVTIDDPYSLITAVYSDNQGGVFTAGEYVFELTVVCMFNEETSNTVTITVGEIMNDAKIISPGENPIHSCSNSLTFTGSTPDPNVSAKWSIFPEGGVSLTYEPNGDVTVQHSSNSVCDYTLVYSHCLGSCISEDVREISFTKSHTNLSISMIDPQQCPTCTTKIRVGGTSPGCNGTAVWSVSPSAGVTIANPNSSVTEMCFPEEGYYDLIYTVENGDCPTTTEVRTCYIGGNESIPLGPWEQYLSCSDTWDYESLTLSAIHHDDVVYQWSVTSNYGTDWINIINPNSSTTEVEFSGVPLDLSNGGLSVVFQAYAQDTINLSCDSIKRITFIMNPTIDVETEDVYLLCGGDSYVQLRDYVSASPVNYTSKVEVLEAPINNNLPANNISSLTPLDLTIEGEYSFMLIINVAGFDFMSGDLVQCRDTGYVNIYVADVPTINAGSDIYTCPIPIVLNGNTPIDIDGNVVDIPVLWQQVSGPNMVTITNVDQQDPLVEGFVVGVYTFVYSFSQQPECIIQDTMMVIVEDCELCDLSISIAKPCEEGCTQLLLTGDADEYIWSPASEMDLSNPMMPIVCENGGGTFSVLGKIDGNVCGMASIDLEPCVSECKIFVEVGTCENGCVQLSVTGNAEELIWSPTEGIDLTDPFNPIFCENEGSNYTVVGLVDGNVCGTVDVEVPQCECIPLEGGAELVFAGCNDSPEGSMRVFDIILPGFPVVPIESITVVPSLYLYYDQQNILHYVGEVSEDNICFDIFIDEDCSQSHCFDLPDCPEYNCHCTAFLPHSCYADESTIWISTTVVFGNLDGDPATQIVSQNVENPGEIVSLPVDPPSNPGSTYQIVDLDLFGTDVNGDGMLTFNIQMLAGDGKVVCEYNITVNLAYICANIEDFYLINGGIDLGGNGPGFNGAGEKNDFSNQKITSFNIYPIPSNSFVHISNPSNEYLEVQIYDSNGKTVSEIISTSSSVLTMPIADLPVGVYLFQLMDGKGNTLHRQMVPIVR